ncbi:MAG: glucose-6-phosphate isomerase [Planctomycetota bacterium]|jgi:glucose-6-phosphate isomerase
MRSDAATEMSELRFDFTNMLSQSAADPDRIPVETVKSKDRLCGQCLDGIQDKRKAGHLGFLDLPDNVAMMDQVTELAETWRGRFDNYVHLGIGGSALGAIAVFEALAHPFHNTLSPQGRGGAPRMFFVDNVDPRLVRSLMDVVDVKDTLFHVVSLSGATVETVSNFLVLGQALKSELGPVDYRNNVVISTDPERGDLQKMARDERISLMAIPPGVGGRFSVLSPPGLLCPSLLGADIREMLQGAERMRERCTSTEMWQNPAFMFALLHFLANQLRQANITVLWSYCQALGRIGDWYCQLIAESLGKRDEHGRSVGLTPTKAIGVTDQHSQLQLYNEGPRDKVITFLAVEELGADMEFPAAFTGYASVDYLIGQTMGKLFHAERRATALSLSKNGCLNCSVSMREVSPNTLGQLFMFFELAVCFLGELFEVNAFDQPGVEESKEYARMLMGKPGLEGKREQLEAEFRQGDRYVI